MITSTLRLSPARPLLIAPIAAPMIASGMTSQLAQPRSGRKAMATKTSATIPMVTETKLRMAWPSLKSA